MWRTLAKGVQPVKQGYRSNVANGTEFESTKENPVRASLIDNYHYEMPAIGPAVHRKPWK
jgi:hypothetical protein